MKKWFKYGAVFLPLFLVACGSVEKKMTSLEIQAIQSHKFETTKVVAFSSVLSVFQDLGYIIKSADKDTGFITAQSATKDDTGFLGILAGTYENKTTAVTASIEELNSNLTTVRLNFVSSSSVSYNTGSTSKDDQIIVDPLVYQNAFSKIGDAIFIRKSSK